MTEPTSENTAPTGATAPTARAAEAPAPTVPGPRRSPTDRTSDTPAAPSAATRPVPPPTTPRRTAPPARRGTRRPNGPAGRGPGSFGNRGPTRTPYLTRNSAQRGPSSAAPALPTPGAQRHAHENRPHFWFAHQLLLTLSGQRPVHALLGHTLPDAYDRLAELAPLSPLRPYIAPGLRAPVPALHACGLCRPREGIIEAFARITTGARLRALAFRLERGADARWRCAALDLGPLP